MRHSYINTQSGRQFWPLSPRAADVDIVDIAHALGNICRFTGHTRKFYSVAEHAAVVAMLVGHKRKDLQLAALHHDSAEAYLCDVASPVKQYLEVNAHCQRQDFGAAEDKVLRCIFERLGIPWPDEAGWLVIKAADLLALRWEAEHLMPRFPFDNSIHEIQLIDLKPPQCFPPEAAKRVFNGLHLHLTKKG